MPATQKVEFECDICEVKITLNIGQGDPQAWVRIGKNEETMTDAMICCRCLTSIDRIRASKGLKA